MNNERIAILTDSGTDVPAEFDESEGVFTVPLSIHYGSETFLDGVDINVDRVYDILKTEPLTTSLPTGAAVLDTLKRIVAAGYDKVLMITISGALSGTHGLMRLMTEEVPELEYRFIDTKNITVGAGLNVIRGVELIKSGLNLDEIGARLIEAVTNTRVFGSLATLKYLARSGRIGRVAATVGSLLTVRPVISCTEAGELHTVERVRGRIQSIQATVRHATEFVRNHRFNLALAHGGARQEFETMKAMTGDLVHKATKLFESNVGPAIGVHSGPGLLGIAVQRLD